MKVMRCSVCGFVYAEDLGIPDEGIRSGTRWADVPEDWVCPDCGSSKSEFHLVELDEASLDY
jgi:rubredoxin